MGAHGLHDWLAPGSSRRARPAGRGCTKLVTALASESSTGPGTLKAVQKLLGHESIQTTGDIYNDRDIDQLAESLLEVIDDE
jgi:integrase